MSLSIFSIWVLVRLSLEKRTINKIKPNFPAGMLNSSLHRRENNISMAWLAERMILHSKIIGFLLYSNICSHQMLLLLHNQNGKIDKFRNHRFMSFLFLENWKNIRGKIKQTSPNKKKTVILVLLFPQQQVRASITTE